ncbi:CPXCG motif-containing cysteine-rich protein [Marinobacter zhejiangensis]|uniref:Cysteine-rich CPXCG n=1 Tax=Marinobacter zhejiangensis TaxID=488535 RepID=A0A1I4NBB3_9GAMM|nr:CPXCG motif-containing cysteine-rich protein [Marinobacter zhejiangensis]SFM12675.1 Cysteine-rich CPXCG [Marinobacter zhejiangensis]
MSALETTTIQCPYCWESFVITVDPSEVEQRYVEDCQVCCQPIVISASFDAQGTLTVLASREND